jgi:hypothetical protein
MEDTRDQVRAVIQDVLKVPTADPEFIFSRSVSSLGTHRAHSFRNFRRLFIMLYAQPWEQPSAVATLSVAILLYSRISSSTRCTFASDEISTSRPSRASSVTFELT